MDKGMAKSPHPASISPRRSGGQVGFAGPTALLRRRKGLASILADIPCCGALPL
jgi:hypothetical protein